jgi:hypothetical protein
MSGSMTEPDQTISLRNQYTDVTLLLNIMLVCLTDVSVYRWGKNKRRKHGTLECNKMQLSLRAL